MCIQVTKTANRFEISSLLEKIVLKQVRWCLTFVRLYILQIYKICILYILVERYTFNIKNIKLHKITIKPVYKRSPLWQIKEKVALEDKWPLKKSSIHMKLSMTRQEKCDLLMQIKRWSHEKVWLVLYK
jgi:hypothetical protein